MQFVITAFDGTDPDAKNRRLAARPAHLELGTKLRNSGNHLYGAAILNDAGDMVGSVLIVQYETRGDLDDYLQTEPYVTGRVWEKIEVRPCRVGPSFADLKPAK